MPPVLKMKKSLIILFAMFMSVRMNAQQYPEYKRSGDKAFVHKEYFEAAYFYKKYLDEKKGKKLKYTLFTYYRLAESYRLYENYAEAKAWYKKVIDTDAAKYPLARLWYGVCLRAGANFDEATAQLQQFKDTYNGESRYSLLADMEIKNCRYAKGQYLVYSAKKVIKSKTFTSEQGDYALTKNQANYFLTSSRFTIGDKHLNRIYTVSGNEVKLAGLNWNDAADAEYGTASLTGGGGTMYFTRWIKQNGITTCSIYVSKLQNNSWTTPVKLNNYVNAQGFNAIQPFVTPDGRRLFFVSSKPGGQGGEDIWISDLDADGNALNAVNAGSTINTAYDEQSPYYDVPQKKLIYSSKGFTGMGGFDFFESLNNAGTWTVPGNMGYPVNSVKDDLYYYPEDGAENKFYISSDRQSDCCLNIFEVTATVPVLKGLVIDCDTHEPLPGVKVSFVNPANRTVIKELVSDITGYTFELSSLGAYQLKLEKQGYITQDIPFTITDEVRTDTLYETPACLQAYKLGTPIVLENILFDFDKSTLTTSSQLILDGLVDILNSNPTINIELAAHTDSKGSDEYNLQLSQNRAAACVSYIVSKGIKSSRLYAKGYGETKPVAPNRLANMQDNPAGRQLNRRTEFTIINNRED